MIILETKPLDALIWKGKSLTPSRLRKESLIPKQFGSWNKSIYWNNFLWNLVRPPLIIVTTPSMKRCGNGMERILDLEVSSFALDLFDRL